MAEPIWYPVKVELYCKRCLDENRHTALTFGTFERSSSDLQVSLYCPVHGRQGRLTVQQTARIR